jgi:hypothetical protein
LEERAIEVQPGWMLDGATLLHTREVKEMTAQGLDVCYEYPSDQER